MFILVSIIFLGGSGFLLKKDSRNFCVNYFFYDIRRFVCDTILWNWNQNVIFFFLWFPFHWKILKKPRHFPKSSSFSKLSESASFTKVSLEIIISLKILFKIKLYNKKKERNLVSSCLIIQVSWQLEWLSTWTFWLWILSLRPLVFQVIESYPIEVLKLWLTWEVNSQSFWILIKLLLYFVS